MTDGHTDGHTLLLCRDSHLKREDELGGRDRSPVQNSFKILSKFLTSFVLPGFKIGDLAKQS